MDGSKRNKKINTIQQQSNGLTRDVVDSKKFERIISKTSVTLSWRESCIFGSTSLSELNPSLITNGKSTPVNDADMSPTDGKVKGTLSPSSSSAVQLAEWMERSKQLENIATPDSSVDILSEFSSCDLLGIWFNADDSATQKVLHDIVHS